MSRKLSLVLFFFTLALLASNSVSWAEPVTLTFDQCQAQGHKATICHATSSEVNPYNKIELACSALYGRNGNAGHFNENGTPLAGHEDDVFVDEHGLCPDELQPTASPIVSPDPLPIPDPSADPQVSPDPTAEPSPSPEVGGDENSESSGTWSRLGYEVCHSESSFEAVYDVKRDGQPVAGVLVTFHYNPTQQAITDQTGRARSVFEKTTSDTLTATANGFPDQSIWVNLTQGCSSYYYPNPEAGVSGSTLASNTLYPQSLSKVLGVSTLPKTGRTQDTMVFILLVMSLVGLSFEAVSQRRQAVG